jgi:hypothetical protein
VEQAVFVKSCRIDLIVLRISECIFRLTQRICAPARAMSVFCFVRIDLV